MLPDLTGALPTYLVAWCLGFLFCLGVGGQVAREAGYPVARSLVAITLSTLALVAGAKGLYALEHLVFPLDDYVPPGMRGVLHGFRIPGGVLLLSLGAPAICGLCRLPWREFGDTLVPVTAFGLIFVRTACFLNGCCFGKVSSLPWAVRFPRGSWVFYYHRTRGWIEAGSPASLPVHPLQLYFVLAACALLAVLVYARRSLRPSGYAQALFGALFFSTSAALEPLRANLLHLNMIVCASAALGYLILLARRYHRLPQTLKPAQLSLGARNAS